MLAHLKSGSLPWHSKNVFVLVLAHLEPELELFKVWEKMVPQSSSPPSRWARAKTKTFLESPGWYFIRTIEKCRKNQTVLSQQSSNKNKKMPHFDYFPRPGGIWPIWKQHILQRGLPKQNQALPSYVHGKYIVFWKSLFFGAPYTWWQFATSYSLGCVTLVVDWEEVSSQAY